MSYVNNTVTHKIRTLNTNTCTHAYTHIHTYTHTHTTHMHTHTHVHNTHAHTHTHTHTQRDANKGRMWAWACAKLWVRRIKGLFSNGEFEGGLSDAHTWHLPKLAQLRIHSLNLLLYLRSIGWSWLQQRFHLARCAAEPSSVTQLLTLMSIIRVDYFIKN